MMKPLYGNGRSKYPRVCLVQHVGGKHRKILIHSLVAEVFLGPRPIGYQVDHIDGDKCNPALSNLQYVTASDNNKLKHSRQRIPTVKGSHHGRSKVTEEAVIEMRQLRKDGWTLKALAEKFGLKPPNVSEICNRKIWRHI